MQSSLRMFAVIGLLVFGSFAANAQGYYPIERKSDDVARDLAYQGRYLSQAQRADINMHLDAIRAIISGQGNPTTPYVCVPKYNDGAAPYILAIRDGVNTKKVGGVALTLADCNTMISTMRTFGPRDYLCVSKYNDGSVPYSLATITSGSLSQISNTTHLTFANCQQNLQAINPRMGKAVICVSKYNDGNAPYLGLSLEVETGNTQRGTDQFNTIEECRTFFK